MNELNHIHQSSIDLNEVSSAKKHLIIAINVFFILVLIPSIYYNLVILANQSVDHFYLGIFEIVLLCLSLYTLFYIYKYRTYSFPAYMDSFIMFVATIAVIIATRGDAYGYAFTFVLGITVFTLLKKSHALIIYILSSLITIILSVFIFNTDFESLFNLFIIIVLSVGILYTFNYSQESLVNKLMLLSRTDVLTGLWNRNMYYKQLRKEINKTIDNQSPLTIMMVDIDFFKRVNDTYGHYTGDEYLKFISDFFLNQLRKTDTVARWGGEEFSFIFPNTPIEDALKIAKRILKKLRATRHEKVGKVTVSMGLTSYILGEDYNELFKRADQALYLSKDNGRDRVSVL